MRDETCEEDLNVNIVLHSGMMTDEDKGRRPEEREWVHKAPKKEVGFDLECAKKPSWKQIKSSMKLLPQEVKISNLKK